MLSVVLGVWALATPTAWHTLDPELNFYGWHNTAVTVILEAACGAGLQVCYRLNAAAPLCQLPPVTLNLSAEGVHTLEYWAVDGTGESPRTRLTVRIDRTPPTVRILSPARDARYLLHQPLRAEWWAYNPLSGLELAEGTVPNGAPVGTGSPGRQTFWVFARDRAGNSARVELECQVVCVIEPVLPTGFFLDRLLPPEERGQPGAFPSSPATPWASRSSWPSA